MQYENDSIKKENKKIKIILWCIIRLFIVSSFWQIKINNNQAIISKNCNEFIECNNGIGIRKNCEEGYEFSPFKYQCIENINSDCIVNKRLKASHQSKCRSKEGDSSSFLLPSEKYSDFIKCAKNKAWTLTCAQNTIFSKEKMSCEWKEKGKYEEQLL